VSTCRGCGKEIVWGTTEEGTKIPLDPRAPVYSLGPRKIGESAAFGETHGDQLVKRTSLAMVSHFATCPKASQFSASNKAKAGSDPGPR
jgi:hypothetical protein